MKLKTAVGVAAAFALVAACFLALGLATRPAPDWSAQHGNQATDPLELSNPFHGFSVRAPAEGKWLLLWKPADFRFPQPASVNKVAEIERVLPTGGSDRQWARMDVFVEPLPPSGNPKVAVRNLEFRNKRPGFQLVGEREILIGGEAGRVNVGQWSVKDKRFRVANYHVVRDHKLFAFVAVAEADAFDRFDPVFGEIVRSVRFH